MVRSNGSVEGTSPDEASSLEGYLVIEVQVSVPGLWDKEDTPWLKPIADALIAAGATRYSPQDGIKAFFSVSVAERCEREETRIVVRFFSTRDGAREYIMQRRSDPAWQTEKTS